MRYEFHPEAEQELLESASRYEAEVPGLGGRFGDEVERAVELLLENPALGAAVDGRIRHFVLQRFPFSIVYAADQDVVHPCRRAQSPEAEILGLEGAAGTVTVHSPANRLVDNPNV